MNTKIITTLALMSVASLSVWAQDQAQTPDQDELNTRHVTVEHEFQPTVQKASKINVNPQSLPEQKVEEQPVVWSDYVGSMEAGKSIISLPNETIAIPRKNDSIHGEMKGGIGHPQSLFEFRYGFGQKKNRIDIDVNHRAYWGERMDERTGFQLRFDHDYGDGNFILRAGGSNECFRYYGRQDSALRNDLQNIWRFNADLGVKSNDKQDFQYLVRAEYKLFSRVGSVAEHQVNAQINLAYRMEDHRFGVDLRSQNQLLHVDDSLAAAMVAYDGREVHNVYALRMEPFYEWHNRRVRLHVGVHLDMNIGRGVMNSKYTDNVKSQVAFAPSPNVQVEADLMPKTVIIYGKAEGRFGYSDMDGYTRQCRYYSSGFSAASEHVSSYRPIIAEVGFRFRPIKPLLISVHGGYEYVMNDKVYAMGHRLFEGGEYAKDYYTNYQRWKFGAQVDYHYRDIIDVHVWGDYYMFRGVKTFLDGGGESDPGTPTDIFDRPSWEIGTKIVGHIDQHWSVYTWDELMGKRSNIVADKAVELGQSTTIREEVLPVYVDINLGVKYHFAGTKNKALDRLGLFFELKNIIHRRNVIWYGYTSQGINGLIGLTWAF